MTQPATASGKGWARYGEGTFVFTDAAYGVVLRLTKAKSDDGHIYADVQSYLDRDTQDRPRLLLTRPRVNLTSDRSLPGLAKSLAGAYTRYRDEGDGGYDYAAFLEKICAVLVVQMDEKGVFSLMEPMDDADLEQPMLFRHFIPQDLVSGLVANGGVGKSMTGSMLVLAIATGRTVGPFEPLMQGPCLYLDWERNGKAMHQRRLTRLCRGLDIPFPQNIGYYEARGKLTAAESDIIEKAYEHRAIFSVLDSIGFAAGGNLNDSDIAIMALNTLKHLPGTKVMMAHVSKSTMNTSTGATGPTGSAFFWNGPQAVYELKAADPELDGSMVLAVHHSKANVGPRMRRPLGVRMTFIDPAGPITPEAVEIRGDEIGGESLPIKTRVLDALGSLGQATTVEIAERLRLMDKGGADQVATTLRELKAGGAVHFFAPVASGKHGVNSVARWGLAAQEGQQANAFVASSDFLCRCGVEATGYDDKGKGACSEHL